MAANLFPSKRMTPEQVGLLSAAVPSPYGDALGLLADGAGYVRDPKSLTLGKGLLSLAGLVPGIPRAGAWGLTQRHASLINRAAEGDDIAYREIRAELEGLSTREDIKRATPLLRTLFPDYTELAAPDPRNDFQAGIWRMANKGDELGRVPTSDLFQRIKAAASIKPAAAGK